MWHTFSIPIFSSVKYYVAIREENFGKLCDFQSGSSSFRYEIMAQQSFFDKINIQPEA
jgi:hypothetical protein